MKYVEICRHLSNGEPEMLQLIELSLHEYLTRSERLREVKFHHCRLCNLLFQLEILDTTSDGLAIVITKWLDLGSGLIPLDCKWTSPSAAFTIPDGRQWTINGNQLWLLEQTGKTKPISKTKRCGLDFEKNEGLTEQPITLRNASYLVNQKHRSIMNQPLSSIMYQRFGLILGKSLSGERFLIAGRPRRLYYWSDILFLFLVSVLLMIFVSDICVAVNCS